MFFSRFNPLPRYGTGKEPGDDPTKETKDPPADDPAKKSTDPPAPEPVKFSDEQQKAIDALITDRLARQKTKLEGEFTAKQKSDKDAADAEEQKKQGKYEDLYNTTKTKLEAAETKLATFDALAEQVNTVIDTATKDWSPSLKKKDPGTENIELRLKWMKDNEEVAAELKAGGNKVPEQEHGKGGGGGKTIPVSKSYTKTTYPGPATAKKP